MIVLVVAAFLIGRRWAWHPNAHKIQQQDLTEHNQPIGAREENTVPRGDTNNSQMTEGAFTDSPSSEPAGLIDQLFRALGGPPLTRAEIRFIQSQYEVAVNKREQHELKLAQAEPYIDGQVLITIPAYAKEGRAIYDQFVSSVSKGIGESAANQFFAGVGKELENLNRGFGAHEQNILIEDTGRGYRVLHGSERTGNIEDQSVIISGVSTGSLSYTNLSDYAYLEPFFPKRKR